MNEEKCYGWFSDYMQEAKLINPKCIDMYAEPKKFLPPYNYWWQDGKKVLVTEVTNSEIRKPHLIANKSVFLGKLDKFCCISDVLLNE